MELYDYYRSSAAYRVRIALNLKQLEWRGLPVNLLQAEQRGEPYRALNPQGLVPALKLDDGSVLTQSIAILEWLEETRPLPPLLPADALDRARVRAMVNVVSCDIHPLNNLRVLHYLSGKLGVGEEQKRAWYHHWLGQGFAALEQQVAGPQYCFGDGPTLADVCLVPQMYNARRFELPLEPFPKLAAICAHLETLPAFASASPASASPEATAGE